MQIKSIDLAPLHPMKKNRNTFDVSNCMPDCSYYIMCNITNEENSIPFCKGRKCIDIQHLNVNLVGNAGTSDETYDTMLQVKCDWRT